MDNDKEKLEREAAKILFSAPAKVEEDVAHEPRGRRFPLCAPFAVRLTRLARSWPAKR